MKREASIKKKGDGKGKLKTRKLKGSLGGETHTFKIRPYVPRIEPAKWELPEPQETPKKTRRPQGRRQPTRRKR